MPEIIRLGEEWDDRVYEMEVACVVQPFFYGESSDSAGRWGVVEGDLLLACLWGTTIGIGEFHVATRDGYRRQGYARRLVESYIASFRHRVRQFQAQPRNPALGQRLAALGFHLEDNGLWVLEVTPATSSRS